MMPSIGSLSRPSRLFLAGALLVLLVLALAAGVAVVRAVALHGELARAAAALQAEANTRASGHSAAEVEAVFIHAASSGLAAADLEKRLSNVLSQAGLTQRSMEVLPTPGPGQGPVTLSIDLTGDTGKLRRALYQMETGVPLVFVKELELVNGHAGEPVAADAPVELAIHLVVEAYARVERRP